MNPPETYINTQVDSPMQANRFLKTSVFFFFFFASVPKWVKYLFETKPQNLFSNGGSRLEKVFT